MPSSTSSSNQRLPSTRWGVVLGAPLLAWLLFVLALEARLTHRGYEPTLDDTEALWVRHRLRASALGERALILIGGSRMLLDADLPRLRERTGLEPVQLAIDGNSYLPVLAGLAADETVRGVVVVDTVDHVVAGYGYVAAARRGQAAFERDSRRLLPDFDRIERRLAAAWRGRLRSYADGAQPLTALRRRALPAHPTPQYVVTAPDRSHRADYAHPDVRAQYLARVLRAFGSEPVEPLASLDELEAWLQASIAKVPPAPAEALATYRRNTGEIAAHAARIRARGGRVYFAMLPKSGLIRELEERRYPRAQFWDPFAARVGGLTAHYASVPGWRVLDCPDGSHLDHRQRAAFTDALVQALALDG